MSQALSNLSFSIPLPPRTRNPFAASPRNGRFQPFTRAMAAERRDSLDHLQRNNSSKLQQEQSQLKKRAAPAVTPVGLWDRFPTARTVQQMMETMDRMIEDPFAYSSAGWPARGQLGGVEGNGFGRGRTPWEIKEGEKEYKMRFDMPGMTKKDVKVWVEEKMLVVKAEKVPTKKKVQGGENGSADDNDRVGEVQEEEEEWPAKSYGKYGGRIALPENVEFEKITAEVRDGVLYITIPKATVAAKILDINVQ